MGEEDRAIVGNGGGREKAVGAQKKQSREEECRDYLI